MQRLIRGCVWSKAVMVWLITDVLLWSLCLMVIIWLVMALKRPRWRDAFSALLRQPVAVISLLVLLFYVALGLLDSLHFQNNGQTYSLLDSVLSPISEQLEVTYSSPFADHSFNKTLYQNMSGEIEFNYARLKHVTPTIAIAETVQHILLDSMIFSGIISILVILISLMVAGLLQRISLRTLVIQFMLGRRQYAWRSMTITFFVLLACTFFVANCLGHYHILGTDQVGHDVFYAAIKSIRTGLIIGTVTTLVMLPFALILGTMAGYFGGMIDDVIQYIYTTLSSIPAVLLIAASVLSIQVFISNHQDWFTSMAARADARLLALCIILGITSWTNLCRVLRAETLKLRELDFIQAAKSLGVGWFKIICRHIIPNTMHLVLIAVVLDFSMLVLAEAVLTYVGVGVDPTTHSWGNMINTARLELAREPMVWWPLISAFGMMFLFVLSANLVADRLRAALDPRAAH